MNFNINYNRNLQKLELNQIDKEN